MSTLTFWLSLRMSRRQVHHVHLSHSRFHSDKYLHWALWANSFIIFTHPPLPWCFGQYSTRLIWFRDKQNRQQEVEAMGSPAHVFVSFWCCFVWSLFLWVGRCASRVFTQLAYIMNTICNTLSYYDHSTGSRNAKSLGEGLVVTLSEGWQGRKERS